MLGSGMALSHRCGAAKSVSCRGPPASSTLRAVEHSWILAVHRSSSTSQARTRFPPGRRRLPTAADGWFDPSIIRFVGHVSDTTGRRPGPSFFVRACWCCPIGVVLIPC